MYLLSKFVLALFMWAGFKNPDAPKAGNKSGVIRGSGVAIGSWSGSRGCVRSPEPSLTEIV